MKKIFKLLLCVVPFMVFMSTAWAREEVYIYLGNGMSDFILRHLRLRRIKKCMRFGIEILEN